MIWTNEDINFEHRRDSYGFCYYNRKFYSIGGYSLSGVNNSLLEVDLDSDSEGYTWVFLNKDYISPKGRMYHSLNIIGTKLYLFGGERFG